MPPEIERVLVPAEQIAALVSRLAAQVNADYAGGELVVVGALTGAAMVTADLVRQLAMPVQMDFVSVSSYGDQTVSALTLPVAGHNVLLVEDIVDTGETLARLQAALLAQEPRSLRTLALLDKPARRKVDVSVDYLGLDIPDEFVVGYGLDYAQRFRNLPFVGVLRRSVYA
ncbi:MAG: hypoxanthine phosphoribosyltransferase [Armatimonadetes bacterium]|nr:hypoxanthine phosphoribosyltransferase [Armatimonadota bacterium]